MNKILMTVLLLGFGTSVAAAEYRNSGKVLPTGLPFSEIVVNGDTFWLAGQIPNKPGSLEIVDGGFEAQARQVMDNIRTTVEHHGYRMDDLVKCTVMMADMENWGAFNAVYATYFDEHFPARSAFGVSGLAAGAALEVECIGSTLK